MVINKEILDAKKKASIKLIKAFNKMPATSYSPTLVSRAVPSAL